MPRLSLPLQALDTSQTLEFARISHVHGFEEGAEPAFDVVAASYPDGRWHDIPRSSIAKIVLDQVLSL
jgi:hypothetical protein